MEVLVSIVSIAATVVGMVVVVRGRQLSRPRFRLHFGGAGLEPARARLARRKRKRVIVYGLPHAQRNYFVVPIAIAAENVSTLPITSVRLSIELPAECVLDQTRIIDGGGNTHRVGSLSTPGRTVKRFRSVAQITFETDLLRPKERLVFHEMVRIACDHVPTADDDHHQSLLTRRWQTVEHFYSAFQVQIVLSAANCEPQSTVGFIAAVNALNEEDLTDRASNLFGYAWDGRKRARGIAGLLWRWKKRSLNELAELVFLRRDSLQVEPKIDIDPTILRNGRTALLQFTMPPWGFSDEVFPVYGLCEPEEPEDPRLH